MKIFVFLFAVFLLVPHATAADTSSCKQTAPLPSDAGIKNTDSGSLRISKTISWLLFGGGLESWANAASRQGLLSPQSNQAIREISCLTRRVLPVLTGQSQAYPGFAEDTMQLRQLIDYLTTPAQSPTNTAVNFVYPLLPAEWQQSLKPVRQILQMNSEGLGSDTAVNLSEDNMQFSVPTEIQQLFTNLAPQIQSSLQQTDWLARINHFFENLLHWIQSWLSSFLQKQSSSQTQK